MGAVSLVIGVDARPATWYHGTGIGNYTEQLVRALLTADAVNEYRLLWAADAAVPELPGRDRTRVLPMEKEGAQQEAAVLAWMEGEGVQVFHVPQNGFRLPVRKACPYVVTVHDLIPFILPETVRRGYLTRFLREMPGIVARADVVVTVSERSAADLQAILGVPRHKLRVVYPAVSPQFAAVDRAAAVRRMTEAYGLSPGYIAYVGGLNERKNVIELIAAYAKVSRTLSTPRQLVVAGEAGRFGPRLAAAIEAYRQGSEVVRLGFVPAENLPALYAAADLFVYPSLYEGFGLPPLEAMACGTPVVACRAGAVPETVGRAALLVEAGDTLGLAAAMRSVLEDRELGHELRRRGFRRVKGFSWRRAASSMLEIYRSLAGRGT